VTAVLVPDSGDSPQFFEGGSVSSVGFDDDACVLQDPATAHPGFRLLREFFAFQEKFGFFDVSLPATDYPEEGHVILMLDTRVIGDGRALAGVTANHLLTRCTPVVNIFRDSVGFTSKQHTGSSVRVDPTKGRHGGAELVAIDGVMAKFDGDRKPPTALPHFFAIRRGVADADGPFWVAMEDDEDKGAENIMFLNRSFDATAPGYGFSVSLLCCDGDRPAQIVCGTPMADLVHSSESVTSRGRLITRPTTRYRFPLGKQASWRLISHLALSQSSLLDRGGDVLKQLLHLYAPAGSLLGEQVIRALVDVRQSAVTRWLPGSFPPTLARGTEIELAIDESHLVGIGLHALVRVLDTFFALYTQVNNFTQLVISSSHTGKELHRCALRTGTGPLI
jgi:type VI secretion system protein ImpG